VTDSTTRSTLALARNTSAEFLAAARAIYDYLRRDMSDSDEQRRALYPVNYTRHVPRYAPIIWALARELATLYLQAPSRRWKRLDGGDLRPETVTMLQQAYERLGVNIAMREHQRHIVALNNATLWVQPHPRTGMAQLVNVPIHDQDVELGSPYAREEDDAAVWRYLVPIPMKGFPAPMAIPATAYITPTLAYWESAPPEVKGQGIWSEQVDDQGRNINPFGTIPVVMSRGTMPAPGQWWSPLPKDLLTAQRAVNHDLTDIGHGARMQAFGQPVAKGISGGAEKEIQMGPETVIGMSGEGADFNYATANPKLAEYGDVIADFVSQVVAMNGMNPATFLKSSGITALAKQVELMDRESFRREHIELMARAEQRLYDVLRAVINTQRGAEVWPEALIEIDYREPVMPADPLHHVQALERAIALGQTGRVRARAVLDGVTLEEARERITKDREADELAGFTAPPIETVADAPVDTSTEAAPLEATPPALDVAPGTEVQKQALNGAQVAELSNLIKAVALGEMPPSTARAIILAAYPLDAAAVDAMLAPLAGFERREPAPEPTSPVLA